MQNDDEWWTPDFNPEEFAREVARLCKLLIIARNRQDDFFRPAVHGDWVIDFNDDKRFSIAGMLRSAAQLLADINTKFLLRCGTGGILPLSDDTPLHRLIGEVAFLVPPSGGDPDHNATLVKYARLAEEGKDIPWDESIQWGSLAAIRKELDQLAIGSKCDGKSDSVERAAIWYHTTPPIEDKKWLYPVLDECGKHCEFTQKQLCQFLDIGQPKTLKAHSRQGRFYIRKRKKGSYSIWFRSCQERAQFNQRQLTEQGTDT